MTKISVPRAELRALRWAVKRAADNNCILHSGGLPPATNAQAAQSRKAYATKVTQARAALSKLMAHVEAQ